VPAVARIGDPGSHGGVIASGSPDVLTNGIGTARDGDTYDCAMHGPNALISTRAETANGRPVVCVGDSASCGAVITAGSPNVFAG
jgi:uncharacterized Zn-binding protein involved in type VI secretion